MEKTVLVTGFEPYGGRGINPSTEVVKRLNGTQIGGAKVVGKTMPVSFNTLSRNIGALIKEVEPSAIVSMGLWPGEPVIRLERLGYNCADFEIPDNEGTFLQDTPLVKGGVGALPSRLPLRAIQQALLKAGIPARISNTAGTYLCNATLYTLLSQAPSNIPCGFVHVPYLPEQVAYLLQDLETERVLELHQRADLASMSLEMMVEAMRVVVAATLAGSRR